MLGFSPNEMRDLLTLAAKAAGFEVAGYDYGWGYRHPAVLIASAGAVPTRWNCLVNDGDCFRLMIDMGLHASPPRNDRESAECNGFVASGPYSRRVLTRLAVTRAAAARANSAWAVA